MYSLLMCVVVLLSVFAVDVCRGVIECIRC